jgi:hypothetical protein
LASQSSATSAATSASSSAATTQSNNVRIGLSQGHGTKGYIPLWLNSLYLGNSALFQDINKNVGIGTATPAATLDVNGAINASTLVVSGYINVGAKIYSNPTILFEGGVPFLGSYFDQQLGTGNIYLGIGTGSSTQASPNTFVGDHAGNSNVFGANNSFLG